jgi:predicted nucleotidyltransferase
MLLQILSEHVPEWEVWAFGSRVSRYAHRGSDLDLVLVGAELFPVERLGALLGPLVESSLPFFVDVLDWQGIPDSFRENIKKTRILLQKPV